MTTTNHIIPMKTSSIPHRRVLVLGSAALTLVCLLALPQTAEAKDNRKPPKHSKSSQQDHARQMYSSHPSTGFTLSLGSGYAGRGYYYGPPNSADYYQRPGVMYYATREAAPSAYYSHTSYSSNSTGAAVQRALASRGYYRGYIDGQIGPQSRQAIAGYQQEQGLRVTGTINSSLLNSLGL